MHQVGGCQNVFSGLMSTKEYLRLSARPSHRILFLHPGWELENFRRLGRYTDELGTRLFPTPHTVTFVAFESEGEWLILPPIVHHCLVRREPVSERVYNPLLFGGRLDALWFVGSDSDSRKAVGPTYRIPKGIDCVSLQFSRAVGEWFIRNPVLFDYLLEWFPISRGGQPKRSNRGRSDQQT